MEITKITKESSAFQNIFHSFRYESIHVFTHKNREINLTFNRILAHWSWVYVFWIYISWLYNNSLHFGSAVYEDINSIPKCKVPGQKDPSYNLRFSFTWLTHDAIKSGINRYTGRPVMFTTRSKQEFRIKREPRFLKEFCGAFLFNLTASVLNLGFFSRLDYQ